eukprot:c4129_g1_i1.p1 GENE.c4129_g1_i1~~c4129_g1_i1.p1  ORF type:complete len:194 (+),score=24.44 c4129_g1_i1:42-584(+)
MAPTCREVCSAQNCRTVLFFSVIVVAMPTATVAGLFLIFVLGESQTTQCDKPLRAFLIFFAVMLLTRMMYYAPVVGRLLYGFVKGNPPIWRQVYHVVTLLGLVASAVLGIVLVFTSKTCNKKDPNLFTASGAYVLFNVVWLLMDAPMTYFLERHWFPLFWSSESDSRDRSKDLSSYSSTH